MIEILGTLGPACQSQEVLEKMFLEGMTGMRLNMSHSGLWDCQKLLQSFHQAARQAGRKPELLIDMQGPELRIGVLERPLTLREGASVSLPKEGEADKGAASLPERMQDAPPIPLPGHALSLLEPGDHILLDDGKLELAVTSLQPNAAATVIRGGTLTSKKSIKIAGKDASGPALTPQDRENIRLAKNFGVTALMQPFVTGREALLEVRKELCKHHMGHIRIFAKIENRKGMEQISDILPHADLIVIARGDLGNDMPLWELPSAQKKLAERCKKAGKPFLVVTQMLASMAESPVPTRAEVSDIFHSVLDGADAVMVTNETAVGRYPVETIRYLKKTAEEAMAWRR